MPDVTLRVVDQFSRPLDDYAAKTDQAEAASEKLASGMQQVDGASEKVAASTQKAGFSFTEINSVLAIGRQAYQAIEGAIKAVIEPTIEYAKQVRDLSRSIGASAEESSKLIQAADDVQVGVNTLTTALEAAIRKGVSPTIEGIGQLADEYNAIQDPIARTKFLMDNFGRSGADLAPLMEQGAAGIKALGENAERTGLVMSQQGVDAARKYEIALDDMEDSTLALKLAIADGLIPAMTQLFSGISKWLVFENQLDAAVKAGAISEEERGAILMGVKQNMESLGEATEYVTRKAEAYNVVMSAGRGVVHEVVKETVALTGAYDSQIERSIALEKSNQDFLASLYDTAGQMAKLNEMLSGPVGKADDDYYAQQKATGAEIAKVNAELEKLRASQGLSVTTVTEATVSQADYNLALDRAALAQRKYAEYNGNSATAQEGLRIAAESAQNSVDKMTEKLGSSTTGFIDNTKQISENEAKLAELNGVYDANAKAHEDATARILFGYLEQSLAADGLTTDEVGFLGEVGTAWGVLDEKTGAAMQNISGALASSKGDAEKFLGVMDSIYSLPDKTIHVNIIQNGYIDPAAGDVGIDNWTPPAGSGGGGGGTTVPPTSDTYTPPPGMNAPSGRGGNTVIQNIFNAPPASDSSLLQTAVAVNGGWQ